MLELQRLYFDERKGRVLKKSRNSAKRPAY